MNWSLIEVGKVYQYKEGGLILIVEIAADYSNERQYEFLLKPIAGTHETLPFTVMCNRQGSASGQFYAHLEYAPAPQWPWIRDHAALIDFTEKSIVSERRSV